MRTLAIARYELRRHMGRTAWQLAVVAAALLPSLTWVDPAGGNAMLTVGGARVGYDSAVLAAMAASSLLIWLGLAGFYLARGNVAAAWASGTGSVLAALPVPGRSFVVGRWLGSLAAVLALGLAMLLGVMAAHAGHLAVPIDVETYLRIWLPLLLPGAVFCTSMAMLCDAWRPALGRVGDIGFFVVWLACNFALDGFWRGAGDGVHPLQSSALQMSALQTIDFAGHYSVLIELARVFHDTALGVEHSQFDPARGVLALPAGFWSGGATGLRLASTVLATLPLWLAVHRFHRYSPDLLRAARRPRRPDRPDWPLRRLFRRLAAPAQLVNGACAPLLRLARPLLDRAAALPGLAGAIGAEVRYTFCIRPAALVLWIACVAAPFGSPAEDLETVALACLAVWGLVMADCATREDDGAGFALTLSYPGGARARAMRQVGAAAALGLLYCLGLVTVWAVEAPDRAAGLVSGLLLASVLAQMLGRATGNARTVVTCLLGYLWLSDRMRELPALDTFALHGLSGTRTALLQLGISALLMSIFIILIQMHKNLKNNILKTNYFKKSNGTFVKQ